MRNRLYISFLISIILSCICCKNKSFDTKEDFINYIQDEDNGYSQTNTINGIKVNITYKPTDVMVFQESSNSNFSNSQKDSLKKKYDKYIYFVLSYSKDNKEILSAIPNSREQFNSIQNTLTFRMNEKVSLTNNKKDTIPLIDFNFPRTYGMSRSTNLLFVFERNKLIEDSDELYFNLSDIGIGIGDMKFKYPANLIKTKFTY